MRPDRSNYEIWFIDLLDGKLSDEQAEELMLFLEQNPDLQEELDGLASVSLKALDIKFNIKEQLLKSPENLSDSQFDNLCIANLENDLTPLQKRELIEMTENNELRKKRFELIQKLKLYPPEYFFEKKGILKKLTMGQKILRLSVIVSSAAAVLALAITSYLSLTGDSNKEDLLSLQDLSGDTIYIQSRLPIKADFLVPSSEISLNESETTPEKTLTSVSNKNSELIETLALNEPLKSGPAPEIIRLESLPMLHVSVPENLLYPLKNQEKVLIPYEPAYIAPLFDGNRSNVDRFLARFFHERIMKDTISGDRPVKSFDIALAGITGINKLFGWEMALHKNVDETGEIRSYYFRSKLIRFNAPVKKTENAL